MAPQLIIYCFNKKSELLTAALLRNMTGNPRAKLG